MRTVLLSIFLVVFAAALRAEDMAARPGWAVIQTSKDFSRLVADVKTAAKAHGLAVVTQAGPTGAAAKRGITIPGNRVIGVFNNDFAVHVLASSTAAMIEAPIRLYVTENGNGTATLSYKRPSFVFEPYYEDGGADLISIAEELDGRFELIARDAVE